MQSISIMIDTKTLYPTIKVLKILFLLIIINYRS